MQTEPRFKRVIWAIDSFVAEPEWQAQTARVIRTLIQGVDVEVEPVCVVTSYDHQIPTRSLASSQLNIPGGLAVHETIPLQEVLEVWTNSLGIPRLQPPRLLVQESGSVTASLQRLLGYAKETSTDFIAVSTHAREGFSRLLLGSFAESLMLQSEIPLLMVNPHVAPTQRYREIVFPTDLSENAEAGFAEILNLAATVGARVTLFHKTDPREKSSSAGEISPRDLMEGWRQTAMAHGLECELVIDDGDASPAEAILNYANGAKSELVAMVSHKRPLLSALLGSVSRQVTRRADCPVWIFHPTTQRRVS